MTQYSSFVVLFPIFPLVQISSLALPHVDTQMIRMVPKLQVNILLQSFSIYWIKPFFFIFSYYFPLIKIPIYDYHIINTSINHLSLGFRFTLQDKMCFYCFLTGKIISEIIFLRNGSNWKQIVIKKE